MADEIKKGPGRPRKEQIIEQNEAVMSRIEDNNADTSPVSRGLREAAIRAEEIRNKMRSEQFDSQMYDEFYIDPSDIPDGWSYEWKRRTVLGAEDPAYQVALARSGCEPVPTSRHPSYMPRSEEHTSELQSH